MSVPSPNSYIEALILRVLAFGNGTLGGIQVRRAGPWSDISALARRDTTELTPGYKHPVRRWMHEPPSELNHAGTLISEFCLHNCEKMNFYNVKLSVYAILLWYPKPAKIC